MTNHSIASEGGCICGHVRYQVSSDPLIVHCCHCRGCQKNSGTAFALNALFEADRVTLLSGEVEEITVPTPSGTGQDITRCAKCKIAVWSNYNMGGLRENIRFIRVGTLDDPDQMPPDVHIYTCSKQPWVRLPENDRRAETFYEISETWSPEALARLAIIETSAGIKIS
ncbi:GFA family protein [Maritalea myrionectae]|uniref:GFA family protein n=1 Tax=Maritalea myrionectae TaxID=454601 RepID=UPI000488D567|nr:GFA family protein [Maritalea myrionectae]